MTKSRKETRQSVSLALNLVSTSKCSKIRNTVAPSALELLKKPVDPWQLTTTTVPAKSEDFYVAPAIRHWACYRKIPASSSGQSSTFSKMCTARVLRFTRGIKAPGVAKRAFLVVLQPCRQGQILKRCPSLVDDVVNAVSKVSSHVCGGFCTRFPVQTGPNVDDAVSRRHPNNFTRVSSGDSLFSGLEPVLNPETSPLDPETMPHDEVFVSFVWPWTAALDWLEADTTHPDPISGSKALPSESRAGACRGLCVATSTGRGQPRSRSVVDGG